MAYPTAITSFTTKVDGPGNTISAAHVNVLQDEISAIETALLSTGLAHHLKFVDATYDIGQAAATRPRHLFMSGDATIGGYVQALTTFRSTSGSDLILLASGANRDITLQVNDVTLWRMVGASGDLAFTNSAAIRRSTSDGADSGSLSLTGGGANDRARGGTITVHGNESGTNGGDVHVALGNVVDAKLSILLADGTEGVSISGNDALMTVTTPGSLPALQVNSTHANGGAFYVRKSGTVAATLAAATAHGFGASDDGAAYAPNGNLYLEAGGANEVRSVSIYDATAADAANVFVQADGTLGRSTSSARYKTDIADLDDWRFLLRLRPVTFRAIRGGKAHMGLLAEDVAAQEPRLVVLDAEGRPDEVAYAHIAAPLIKAVQELSARLTHIETQ